MADVLTVLGWMAEGDGFDPATSQRTFRIAATDYGSVAVLGPLAAQVAREASGVCLDVIPFGPTTLVDLENGALDCALDADVDDLPPDFHYRELFRDGYACILRRGHPCLAKEGDILRHIAATPQVIMMYPEGGRMVADEVLRNLGMAPAATALRTPYFMSTPWIIAESNLVICVPRRLAERLASVAALEILPLPDVPSFSFCLIWHERVHRDPGMRWIRSLLRF